MKVTELQEGHYYTCYQTWADEVDKNIIFLIHFSSKEWIEDWKFYRVYGYIIRCTPSSTDALTEFLKVTTRPDLMETEFKEITEEQFNDIRNKYTVMYSTAQQLWNPSYSL